jgi:hypothetical protein
MIPGRSIMNLMVMLFLVNDVIGQTKEQVIEKYLKAIGGKENWLAVRSKIDSGMIINYTNESFFNKEAKTDTVFFSTILEMPNKLKFTSYKRHPNSSTNEIWTTSSMCYNGTYLWTGRPGSTSRQSPEESEYFAKTIASGVPYLFLYDKTAEIEYMGKMKLDSSFYEVLKIKGTSSFFYDLLYFDGDTGLIACTVGFDTPIKRYSYTGGYRWIDNLLIDTIGESYVDRKRTSVGITFGVKVNAVIKESVFKEDQ